MNPSGKVILNYGAMSGLSCFGFFLLLFTLGWNPLGQISWLGAWIPVIFIALSTGYFRDKLSGGYITYGHAFRIGFLTACCGAFMFDSLVYIFGTFINNTILDTYKTDMLTELEKTKSMFGERFYELSMESLEKTTMYNIVSSDFFLKVLGGALTALITSGFYRKNKTIADPVNENEAE